MIFFFFISSSLLFSFLRFSLLSFSLSSLVLSLLLHVSFSFSLFVLLFSLFSFLLHLLFHLLFSFLRFSFLLSSFLLSSLFFLCLLSLSLSLCVGGVCVVVCLCGVVWCGVVCAVWCGTLKTPCVDSKRFPCVHSKRPRVYRHHAHMLKGTIACRRLGKTVSHQLAPQNRDIEGIVSRTWDWELSPTRVHIVQRVARVMRVMARIPRCLCEKDPECAKRSRERKRWESERKFRKNPSHHQLISRPEHLIHNTTGVRGIPV